MTNKIWIYTISAMVLGLIIGSLLGFLNTENKKIVRKALPTRIIQELTLTQLNANVSGTITNKTENSFILETKDGPITIYLEERGLTQFTKMSNNEEVDFGSIENGDVVTGGISIIVEESELIGLSSTRKLGDILAHSFVLIQK